MPDRVFIDSNLWIYSFVEAEEVLYSEDMQHDLVIQGRLRIQNPFW